MRNTTFLNRLHVWNSVRITEVGLYLQIALAPEDRPYHRFLWRDDAQSEMRYYEFNRLVFGVNASPFLAQYVAQQTARDHAASLPRAAEAILASTYMDDTMDSVDTPSDGQQLHRDLNRLWNEACMTPRKCQTPRQY